MQFKNWYVLNEVRVADPVEFKKRLLGKDEIPFYVDANGQISFGYDKSDTPAQGKFNLVHRGKYRRLNADNVQPTSKKFKDVIAALRPFVPDIDDYDVEVMVTGGSFVGRPNRYNRKVRYYLSQADTDFVGKRMPDFLYHGTCTELWYEGIKTQGLLPRKLNAIGGGGSYGNSVGSISHDDKIYLSVHPDMACRSAATQAASKHGGQPLIVKVSTKGLYPEKFVQDEDFDWNLKKVAAFRNAHSMRPQSPAQASQLGMGAVAYVGRIPPSNITPFSTKEDTSVPGGKWFPFNDVARSDHPLTVKFNGRGIDAYDSPYYYALLDSGLGTPEDDEKTVKGNGVPDAKVREVIRKSPWVVDAAAISKDVNDFGMSGVKSLADVKLEKVSPGLKWATDILIKSRLYYDEKGYMSRIDSWRPARKIIALSKLLHGARKSYQDLLAAVGQIDRTAR